MRTIVPKPLDFEVHSPSQNLGGGAKTVVSSGNNELAVTRTWLSAWNSETTVSFGGVPVNESVTKGEKLIVFDQDYKVEDKSR